METISRKDLTLAWLAGMIDADGCISFHMRYQNRRAIKTSHRLPYVQLTTTCTHTAQHLERTYQELDIPYHLSLKVKGALEKGHKPVYEFVTSGLMRCKRIIPLIQPYLVTKQKESQLVMEFIEIRERLFATKQHDPREEAISQEMKQIKAERNTVRNPQRLYARLH